MNLDQFEDRKTTTYVKDFKGSFFKPQMIQKPVDVYELSPQEAQSLNKEGYVMKWIHKEEHHKGEPKLRLYEFIGRQNERNKV